MLAGYFGDRGKEAVPFGPWRPEVRSGTIGLVRRGFRALVVVAFVATVITASARAADGIADAPECIQVSLPNTTGPPENENYGGPISPDGRYVLVTSSATDVGVVDLNLGERDVFVHDMQTDTIELVSKTTGGAQVDATSGALAITPNGRYVLMSSWGDLAGANNQLAIYLRDRQLGTTSLIVGQFIGAQVAYGDLADISDDGRYVAFVTALSLVAADTNGEPDVYRLDRSTGQNMLVSVADDETPLPLGGKDVSMSADGNLVSFMSDDLNRAGIRDIAAGTTRPYQATRLRLSADGATAVATFGSELRWMDVASGAVTNTFYVAYSGSYIPTHFSISANARYAMLDPSTTLIQVDGLASKVWYVPADYYATGYVSDSGVVSSFLGRRPYLWRGPIASIDSQPLTYIEAGKSKDFSLTGRNIFEGATYSFGPGTTTTVLGYPNESTVNLRVTVDPFALDGPRDLTFTNILAGCRTTKSQLLEVLPRSGPPPTTTPPTTSTGPTSSTVPTSSTTPTTTRRGLRAPLIYDMTPTVLRPGVTERLIVVGNNMVPGIRLEIPDVTVVGLDYINNRRIEANVVANPAASGGRTVRVVNPDNQFGDSPMPIVIRGTDGDLHAQSPRRQFDSRVEGAPIVGERVVTIGGLPTTGVRAVIANLTVTNPTSDSYLTLFRAGTNRPTASNINFRAGETKANLVTVEVDDLSRVAMYLESGAADVILDVVGYYNEADAPAGSGFVAVDPYRRFDSRIDRPRPLGPAETVSLPLVPSGGHATAALLNVTVTNPTATSYLTIWPTGSVRPTTSNINFDLGQTVPNLVVAPVGPNGAIDIYNFAGDADVIVDVLGWFDDGAGSVANARFTARSPQRAIDTRLGVGAPLGPGGSISLDTSGVGIPGSATAVVMNVTVDQPTVGGYLTVWHSVSPMPGTSNLNFGPGMTTSNLVVVRIGADRRVNFANAYGSTHVIADVVGYFD